MFVLQQKLAYLKDLPFHICYLSKFSVVNTTICQLVYMNVDVIKATMNETKVCLISCSFLLLMSTLLVNEVQAVPDRRGRRPFRKMVDDIAVLIRPCFMNMCW